MGPDPQVLCNAWLEQEDISIVIGIAALVAKCAGTRFAALTGSR